MAQAEAPNRLLVAAGLAGLSGVAAGAFGAHALQDALAGGGAPIWQTGVLYHLIHALALLALALAPPASGLARGAGLAFLVGIVLFSGSLYALALTRAPGLALVTPFGGLAFLVGWGLLILAGLGRRTRS